jgi:hypothetical protein
MATLFAPSKLALQTTCRPTTFSSRKKKTISKLSLNNASSYLWPATRPCNSSANTFSPPKYQHSRSTDLLLFLGEPWTIYENASDAAFVPFARKRQLRHLCPPNPP